MCKNTQQASCDAGQLAMFVFCHCSPAALRPAPDGRQQCLAVQRVGTAICAPLSLLRLLRLHLLQQVAVHLAGCSANLGICWAATMTTSD